MKIIETVKKGCLDLTLVLVRMLMRQYSKGNSGRSFELLPGLEGKMSLKL